MRVFVSGAFTGVTKGKPGILTQGLRAGGLRAVTWSLDTCPLLGTGLKGECVCALVPGRP